MTALILRRVAAAVPVLLVALTLSFALIHLVPGDPVDLMLRSNQLGGVATAEQEAELRSRLGLDQPLIEQYGDFVGNAVRGDFGTSLMSGRSTLAQIGDVIPATLQLAAAALAIAVVVGVTVALLGTVTEVRLFRWLLTLFEVIGISMPVYWVGILLLEVFSFRLGWFPGIGRGGPEALVLPAITMALHSAGVIAQVLGSAIRRALKEPYIATAKAKGASRRRIRYRHALRNAAIPAITVAGTTTGNLIAGAVIVETVFSREGVGRLTITAITNYDYPLVQTLVFVGGAAYILANLVIDLIYTWVDPRIQFGSRQGAT